MTRAANGFLRRLGTNACFAGLTRRDLAIVAGLVDPIEVPSGGRFGGQPGREVMIIEAGTAVEGDYASALLGPNALVGPSGATALTRVRLLVIDRRALAALLDVVPLLAEGLRDGYPPVSPPPRPRPVGEIASPARARHRIEETVNPS